MRRIKRYMEENITYIVRKGVNYTERINHVK